MRLCMKRSLGKSKERVMESGCSVVFLDVQFYASLVVWARIGV